MKYTFTTLLLLLVTLTTSAQNYWTDEKETNFQRIGNRYIIPNQYRTIAIDSAVLKQQLAQAPLEQTGQKGLQFAIPMPDGQVQNFLVEEAPVMEAGLAAQFPLIKTYVGRGVENPHASIRLGWTYKGFHATIYAPNGTVYIDPYDHQNKTQYISYFKKDYQSSKTHQCLVENYAGDKFDIEDPVLNTNQFQKNIGDQLRTYRLAMACTGEYSQFHGGTINSVLSAIVTTTNRVTGVYERELSVRLVLVNNNQNLIFLNAATDPYTNTSAGQMITQNTATINSIIGSANYDIGHVFSTGGGGLAGLGVVCSNNGKGRGVTGLPQPIGDPFDIDFVAHEVGHQFAGNHTFNGSSGSCGSNRAAIAAYEPGSGTTIMAYAGICGADNLANNSDDYFHTHSFDEMVNFIQSTNCAVITNTGNSEPNVDAGVGGFFIPISTPFELTGSATDPDGDPLTYCWEQHDLGPQGSPNNPFGNAPLFRSFDPVTTPTRVFPRIQNIVNNTQTIGEILPTYNRQLSFRLTARDNVPGHGGVSYDGISFSVTNQAGPFLVTEPNVPGITWTEGALGDVKWDVANTDQAPVSAATVDIFLSIDGGFTYPFTLATGVPNDGSETVFVPVGTMTTTARVKVKAANNVFFDISNANFVINAPSVPDFTVFGVDTEETVCVPDGATFSFITLGLLNFNDPINLSASNIPNGAIINYNVNPAQPGDTVIVSVTNTDSAQTGTYPLTITASSTTGTKDLIFDLVLYETTPTDVILTSPANGATDVAIIPQLMWEEDAPHTYDIEIATDINFNTIVESANGLTQNTYAPNNLQPYTIYYWRVKSDNQCTDPSTFSEPFAFRTTDCKTYFGGNSINISSNITATYVSTLNVPDNFSIVDVNVLDLTGTHTAVGDLSFKLRSPSGTEVELLDQICGDDDDFLIGFDDDGLTSTIPCPPVDGNLYQPIGTLADFNGESSQGNWTIRVQDNNLGNGGTLQDWSLNICDTDPNPDPVLINNDTLVMTIGALDTIQQPLLLVEDANNTASELTYTLLTLPTKGNLIFNGTTLTVGATFTQADIDAQLLLYQHNGTEAEVDEFSFYVTDGIGGWLPNATYYIAPRIPFIQPEPPLPNGTVTLFPNPTSVDLNISVSTDNDEQITITMYDMAGKLIQNATIEQTIALERSIYMIPVQHLANGMYIVKVEGQSFEVIEKVIVVK